jgi:hypothetical protein
MFWREHLTKPELKSMWVMLLAYKEYKLDQAKGAICEHISKSYHKITRIEPPPRTKK